MQTAPLQKAEQTSSVKQLKKSAPFFTPVIQPKLTVNQPNDMYEQEADRTADKVLRMPAGEQPFFSSGSLSISRLQRKCRHCEEEEKAQRKESSSDATVADTATENYISSLHGKGHSLTREERSFFEPRFGCDFSDVQLHTDAEANQSAKDVNALAYTHKSNIVFAANQYQFSTDAGRQLLAHELTHVMQQQPGTAIQPKTIQREGDPNPSSTSSLETDYEQYIKANNWGGAAAILAHFSKGVIAIKLNALKDDEQRRAMRKVADALNLTDVSEVATAILAQQDKIIFNAQFGVNDRWVFDFLKGLYDDAGMKEVLENFWKKAQQTNDVSVTNGLKFHLGLSAGFVTGVGKDLWSQIKGLAELVWQLVKINWRFYTDPEGLVLDIKNILEGFVNAFLFALNGREVGYQLGRYMGSTITEELINAGDFGRGEFLGEKLGMLVTEIALLFVGVEEVTAAVRIVKGTRLFIEVSELLGKSEKLKEIMMALKGTDKTREIEAVTAKAAKVSELAKGVNAAGDVKKAEFALTEMAKYEKEGGELVSKEMRTVEGTVLKEKVKDPVNFHAPEPEKAAQGFDTKVKIGEHDYYHNRNNGTWCRYSEPPASWCGLVEGLADDEKLGFLKKEGSPDIRADRIDPRAIASERIGVQQGKEYAISQRKLKELNMPHPTYEKGEQGFDDIMEAANGDWYILEYKGGDAELAPGQMENAWVKKNIQKLRDRKWDWQADLIEAKLKKGQLKGLAIKTPVSKTGVPLETSVIKEWAYVP